MQRSLADCITRYGAITNGTWEEEDLWCGLLVVDPLIARNLLNTQTRLPTKHIYCNHDMSHALTKAFASVIKCNLLSQLVTYDGCLYCRTVRGCTVISTHAYGLAVDLNAFSNPLGSEGNMTADFVKCFTDEGFSWGGNFKSRRDPMHFSYGWE